MNATDPSADPLLETLREALLQEHQPATPTESLLVEEMAQAQWRLDRVRRRQDQAFETDALDAKLLAILLRYAIAHERTFYKSLQTLKKLQHERLAPPKQTFVSQKAEREAYFKMLDEITAPPPPLPRDTMPPSSVSQKPPKSPLSASQR